MELVHHGTKKFDIKRFDEIQNDNWIKPKGGLWTSPVNSEWGWKDWCEGESFRLSALKVKNTIILKEDANLLIVDSYDDLTKIPFIKIDPKISFVNAIDFEKLVKEYDGMWLTIKGERETRYSRPLSLYGWDCETVLLFNKHCFKTI